VLDRGMWLVITVTDIAQQQEGMCGGGVRWGRRGKEKGGVGWGRVDQRGDVYGTWCRLCYTQVFGVG
jgi:hypothetical protein